jgi:FlaG/FlaF family flagellin (archaellin)
MNVRRFLRDKKGVTPVLSNVLLMAIAVAGMMIAITATYVITNNLRETMGERFIVEDVWFNGGNEIAIYVRNIGKMPIEVVAVYVNYTSESFTELELGIESHGWVNATYSWGSDSIYNIKVVTTRGTQVVDYYRSPS